MEGEHNSMIEFILFIGTSQAAVKVFNFTLRLRGGVPFQGTSS